MDLQGWVDTQDAFVSGMQFLGIAGFDGPLPSEEVAAEMSAFLNSNGGRDFGQTIREWHSRLQSLASTVADAREGKDVGPLGPLRGMVDDLTIPTRAFALFCEKREGLDPAPLYSMLDLLSDWNASPEEIRIAQREVKLLHGRLQDHLFCGPLLAPPENPEPKGKPGFLGLIVDEGNRRVRRQGFPCEIEFRDAEAQWHTFFVGHKAEERGATNADWLNGYPGYADAESRKQVKHKLKNKLQDIGLSVEKGSGVKIIEWDGK